MTPRIIYLVSEDWYFFSHSLPMARAAQRAGFQVHVATRVDRHSAAIEAEGFELHPLRWERGSLAPQRVVLLVRDVRALYRRIKPDLAHHVALQASVVGSLAAHDLPVICLNAMTGLGSVFVGNTVKLVATRAVLSLALRPLLNRQGSAVLVQNPDDQLEVERLGVESKRIAMIRGSGVDLNLLWPSSEPAGPVTIAFAGRLVDDKGIRILVAAHEILCLRGRDIRLVIAGLPDPANPSSLSLQEIASWHLKRNVVYIGFTSDMARFWATNM